MDPGGSRSRRRAAVGLSAPVLALCMVLACASSGLADGCPVVTSVRQGHGAIALTFDDGWGETSCERIARTLRAAGVKATFFINGVHLKAQPAFWKRVLRGMPVGNHTAAHKDLTKETSAVVRRQLARNEAIHEQVLGRPMVKVFRPPYGAQDARVRRIASSLGYRYTVLWSRSAADTSSAATRTSIIRRTTGARPGTIILMHCARSVTADALPTIIRHYKSRGIRMVGLDTLLGMAPAAADARSPGSP